MWWCHSAEMTSRNANKVSARSLNTKRAMSESLGYVDNKTFFVCVICNIRSYPKR